MLNQFPMPPHVFILRMRLVPLIDTSGVTALRQMLERCQRGGTRVILSGLREQPRAILEQMNLQPDGAQLQFAENFAEAVADSARRSAELVLDRMRFGRRRRIADHVDAFRRRELERVGGELRIALPFGKADFGTIAESILEPHARQAAGIEAEIGSSRIAAPCPSISGAARSVRRVRPARSS